MKLWNNRAMLRLIFTFFIIVLASPLLAAGWPTERPIHILAPSTAGGAADTFARVLAEHMPPLIGGGTIVVDNRVGGGGLVAVAATSQAPPDGYTLVISSAAYNTIEPFVSKIRDSIRLLVSHTSPIWAASQTRLSSARNPNFAAWRR